MAEPSAKKLQCVIVTPETTVLDLAVDFVAVPLFDGELGVFPGRSPVVARLGHGELRTQVGTSVSSYFIDGGFLQVRNNVVSVLTSRASTADGIDAASARADLETANALVPSSEESFEAKTISLARARGQLSVARRTGKA